MVNLKAKKRKDLIDKILNHSVTGEAYILTPSRKWKMVVLRNFNKVYRKEISVNDLIQIMRKEGIVFGQKETIIQYPIIECLRYIAKQAKKKLDI